MKSAKTSHEGHEGTWLNEDVCNMVHNSSSSSPNHASEMHCDSGASRNYDILNVGHSGDPEPSTAAPHPCMFHECNDTWRGALSFNHETPVAQHSFTSAQSTDAPPHPILSYLMLVQHLSQKRWHLNLQTDWDRNCASGVS